MDYRALALAVIFLLIPVSPFAQELPDDDVIGVRQQYQPDYEPLGIRSGAFNLNPSLEVSEEYDDNIFRDETGKKSDFITAVKPGLNVRSDWNLHEVQFTARGDLGYYADNSNEDYRDYALSASGRYDITYETALRALAQYERFHEDRGSPDDVNGDEPTTFDRWTTSLGFARTLGRLKLFINGQYQDYTFDDTTAAGVVIDNSNRNRSQTRIDTRLAYELVPNYDVFVSAAWDVRDYDRTVVVDRNSEGYELRAGTALNITGKVKGEIYAGQIATDYSSDFEDIKTINYGGSLLWNLTGLTSVYANVDRSVIETVSGDSTGYVLTASRVGVDHALRRNVMLGGFVGHDQNDYIGTAPGAFEREDEAIRTGLRLEYKPVRGAAIETRYDYVDRESNVALSDFTDNRLMLTLKYSF